MKKYSIEVVLFNFLLLIVALIFLFPLFWMLLISLKEFPEKYSNVFEILISAYSVNNYSEIVKTEDFSIYFFNSLIVASVITLGNVLFCFMVAYILERKNFKINQLIFGTILSVLVIPQHIVMIPLYRLMVSFGWLNTYYALIVPWLVTPFGVFLVKQYIKQLPKEIEESARLDGCSYIKIIFKIVMPLSYPILVVLAIFTFLSNWNSFLFPFLFTSDETVRTLPVGLAFYFGKQSIDWGKLMAGASVSSLPILLLFIIFQKYVIKGLLQGSLKM
ncbi:MAG: carbohydrate ABC transporter permease [Candidatus Kapaibacteriales bacterium]